MAARKKIAPDWRGDVKRIETDIVRLHNGVANIYAILKEYGKLIELHSQMLSVGLLPTEQTNAVDSSEDRKDKPLEPFGSLGEYIEPLQDVPAVSGNEAANEGNTQNQ